MNARNSNTQGRRCLRALAVVPVATVAWLGIGTGAALAAPGGHDTAAANSSATANSANANSGNANGGVGQGNGNGNAKHDTSTAPTASTPTASAPADQASTPASSHGSSGTAGTSGDPTKPQPNSNADNNSGGANGQCPGGPYCSTRDGSASGNGNGNGKAVGKPCAGCVGKADNKNPKGQNPNGSDHNAGYECDRNHGIGRTNPAHTGCKSGGSTSNCEPPNLLISGECIPPNACPEGEHMAGDVCLPDDDCVPTVENHNCTPTQPCVAPAHAGPNGTCVLGEKHTRKPTTPSTPSTPTTSVLGTKVTRLPFTGASVGWMVEGGMAAITMGTLTLVAGGRRRRQRV